LPVSDTADILASNRGRFIMKRLLVSGAIVALLAACNSQGDETEAPGQSAADAAEATPAEAAPTAAPAMAAATAAAAPGPVPAGLAKGVTVEVTRQAECFETGPGADETPWDVYPGVTKTILAVEGDKLRVAIGDTECLLPADAVKLSAS
jgi:hypothetical protein